MDLERVCKRTVLQIRSLIPKNQLVSIYLKGSYARGEATLKSDVDFVIIVKSSKYVILAKKLNTKIIQIAGYTLKELQTGKRFKGATATPPERTNWHWQHFKLLYGKDMATEKLFFRDSKKMRESFVRFLVSFIKLYEQKKVGFGDVCKQVLWLGWNDLLCEQGINLYSWKEIAAKYPKNHVIAKAYRYRVHPLAKESVQRAKYISELRKYLYSP